MKNDVKTHSRAKTTITHESVKSESRGCEDGLDIKKPQRMVPVGFGRYVTF